MALDVGTKRIGVALGDNQVRIAIPYGTIEVDGNEFDEIRRLIGYNDIDVLVVGYPRNQSGEATAQSRYVEEFVENLGEVPPDIIYQDESLTSVIAEDRLKKLGKPYEKADIDSMAATIILDDYMELDYENQARST